MRRKLPSLQALQYFEAAARNQSFTKAATELFITQGAVSRQVKTLEDFLGFELFTRTQHGMKLTEAGKLYADKIKQRLDELERDTIDLINNKGIGKSLNIACVPTFGTRWLIPRLHDFYDKNPNIIINFEAKTRPFLFSNETIDAAIFALTENQAKNWAGTKASFLMKEESFPICSPKLFTPNEKTTAQDIMNLPLIHQATRQDAWSEWFEAQAIDNINARRGSQFEQFSMQAEAAKSGIGIGLIPKILIEKELERGELIIAINIPHPKPRNYYIFKPQENKNKALEVFENWLVSNI